MIRDRTMKVGERDMANKGEDTDIETKGYN